MNEELYPQLSNCSLSASKYTEQITWLRDLTSRALVSHDVRRNQAKILFQPTALKEIEELIRRESACCDFFTFSIQEANKTVQLTLTWSVENQESAINLLSNFLPE